MKQVETIASTGRALFLLTRAGQAASVLFVIAIYFMLYRIGQPALQVGFFGFLAHTFSTPPLAIINGWIVLRAVIYIWALGRIRLIGIALIRHEPISRQVADAVRRSARALLVCGFSVLLQFDMTTPGLQVGPKFTYAMAWEFSWMAFYVVILLCVCVLVIARILRAAVDLKAENAGFV